MLLVGNVEPSLLSCHLCVVHKYHKVLVAIGSNNPVGMVDYYSAFNNKGGGALQTGKTAVRCRDCMLPLPLSQIHSPATSHNTARVQDNQPCAKGQCTILPPWGGYDNSVPILNICNTHFCQIKTCYISHGGWILWLEIAVEYYYRWFWCIVIVLNLGEVSCWKDDWIRWIRSVKEMRDLIFKMCANMNFLTHRESTESLFSIILYGV
jgi:hypothetical protein